MNMLILILEIFLILVVLFFVCGFYKAFHEKIVNYEINIDKKNTDLKELNVVMVSDIHLGKFIGCSRLENMVTKINELNADIVILAGDIIDGDIEPFKENNMADIISNLKSKYGTFAVLGNHEFMSGKPTEVANLYEEAGITVLRDDAITIDNQFCIIGREDLASEEYYQKSRQPLSNLISNVDTALPVIIVDHQPADLEEGVGTGADLQLSGHTHKGQVFPGNLITKKIYELNWGYKKKGFFNVIVTSGYGTCALPVRIATNSEIVNIKLNLN